MTRGVRVAAIALALAGCAANGDSAPTTRVDTTPPANTAVPQASAAPTPTTGTPEDQLRWYVKALNGTAEISEDRYADRFGPSFRDGLPFEQFLGFTNQLSTGAPFTIDSLSADTPSDDDDSVEAAAIIALLVAGDGTGVQLRLATDDAGYIVDLAVIESTETPEPDEPPASLSGTADSLSEYGRPSWIAATVPVDATAIDDVACAATEADGADEPVAVGAAMKVWILAAVAKAVMSEELSWDTELILTARDKSLPPGVLRDRPDDTPVTVGDAAKMLFEYTDNTAADLLIRTVGRERVQAAQTEWGGTHGDLNDPFLTTREMFVLKTAAPEVKQRYQDANREERVEMLSEVDSVFADQIPADVLSDGPAEPEELSWFASPTDICTGLARLMWTANNVDGLGELSDILTVNHGVPDDNRWTTIAYAGGSEPGQLTMAWIMQGADEKWYGFVANLINPTEEFDTAEPTLLMAAGRDLLAPGLADDDATVVSTAPSITAPTTTSG